MDDFQLNFLKTLLKLDAATWQPYILDFPSGEKYNKEIEILKIKVPHVLGDLAVELGLATKTGLWPFFKIKSITPLTFFITIREHGSAFDEVFKRKREEKKVKEMLDSINGYANQVEHLLDRPPGKLGFE